MEVSFLLMLRPSISIRLQQYRIEAVVGFFIGYNELDPDTKTYANATRVNIIKTIKKTKILRACNSSSPSKIYSEVINLG